MAPNFKGPPLGSSGVEHHALVAVVPDAIQPEVRRPGHHTFRMMLAALKEPQPAA
eukprot:CAMPEP_0181520322 /NCGR_PEP_ID=MMETSP1110-20121109/66246_1 /TAXON_ID=174948 /ORGANISM="Symbiodinium sp., Strain CCMP421" /LENGTH=54 /DNA_ID=CAMNT_0023650799 /DNA_START=426 /DNA_END=586 /DNA_ORIENTATION=+